MHMVCVFLRVCVCSCMVAYEFLLALMTGHFPYPTGGATGTTKAWPPLPPHSTQTHKNLQRRVLVPHRGRVTAALK